jgi:hypothetical protein
VCSIALITNISIMPQVFRSERSFPYPSAATATFSFLPVDLRLHSACTELNCSILWHDSRWGLDANIRCHHTSFKQLSDAHCLSNASWPQAHTHWWAIRTLPACASAARSGHHSFDYKGEAITQEYQDQSNRRKHTSIGPAF